MFINIVVVVNHIEDGRQLKKYQESEIHFKREKIGIFDALHISIQFIMGVKY